MHVATRTYPEDLPHGFGLLPCRVSAGKIVVSNHDEAYPACSALRRQQYRSTLELWHVLGAVHLSGAPVALEAVDRLRTSHPFVSHVPSSLCYYHIVCTRCLVGARSRRMGGLGGRRRGRRVGWQVLSRGSHPIVIACLHLPPQRLCDRRSRGGAWLYNTETTQLFAEETVLLVFCAAGVAKNYFACWSAASFVCAEGVAQTSSAPHSAFQGDLGRAGEEISYSCIVSDVAVLVRPMQTARGGCCGVVGWFGHGDGARAGLRAFCQICFPCRETIISAHSSGAQHGHTLQLAQSGSAVALPLPGTGFDGLRHLLTYATKCKRQMGLKLARDRAKNMCKSWDQKTCKSRLNYGELDYAITFVPPRPRCSLSDDRATLARTITSSQMMSMHLATAIQYYSEGAGSSYYEPCHDAWVLLAGDTTCTVTVRAPGPSRLRIAGNNFESATPASFFNLLEVLCSSYTLDIGRIFLCCLCGHVSSRGLTFTATVVCRIECSYYQPGFWHSGQDSRAAMIFDENVAVLRVAHVKI
ncbi:hypothetical protein BKA63DRAFT_497330 [Paraphoma chrysanthemicola]|nr:hypothetical protein BKA63DRAFT_497330 [Paraphoma chrysanthemicola]